MNIDLPPVGPNAMVQLIQALRRAFTSVVSKDEAVSRLLISDSSMQIWEVAITTSGAVTTTTFSGKNRAA